MTYRSSSNPFDGFRAFVRKGGTPVTNALLIVNTVLFFATFLSRAVAEFVASNVLLTHFDVLRHPWTIATYPLVTLNILTLIWSGMWMFFIGGSLERSWGSSRFAIFFFAMAALFGLGITIGWLLLGTRASEDAQFLVGLYPPLAGVTVAWGLLMPEESVSIWFVPVRAKYIALGAAILAWVLTGAVLGLFAELCPLAAFIYVRYGRSWGTISHQTQRSGGRVVKLDFDRKGKPRRTHLDGSTPRSPFDIAGKIRDMQERRRLEKLLRNSGIKEPDWIDEDRKYNP
jgi:membrane associated rhomboid family serine protease